MTGYRCYFLSDQDRIQSAENLEAARLDEAIDRALAMLGQRPHHHSIELWQDGLRLYASREQLPRHQCHIYDGAPSQTLPTMAMIIGQKLKENLRCLYLNSPPMIAGMKFYLTSVGVDAEQQIAKGALTLSSDQEHLHGGQFDADRMLATLETVIDQALNDGYKGMWASGDMTWEVGPQCNVDELLEYEWRLEEIFRRRSELSGICQYHADTLPRDLVSHGLAAHRSIFVNETLSRINPHYLAPFSEGAPHPGLGAMVDELCVAARHAE
jgi:hypothetical protein